MRNTVWYEYLRRGIQLFLGIGLFEIPVLMKFRVWTYVVLFNGQSRGARIHRGVMFSVPHQIKTAYIEFGDNVDINHGVEVDYSGQVHIGKRVWISQNVLIETHEHVLSPGQKHSWPIRTYPLIIEDDVWIGANVVILPKTGRIGRGAVIGAGSIVTRPVPDGAVVAGNPAKVTKIRELDG